MAIACAPRPVDGVDDVVVGRTGRRYTGKAFGLLPLGHPVRRRFMALVDWRWFDRVVLLLILLNCVAMAASDPVAVEPYAWERPAEWFFTIAFTVEALCKMVAMGICCESRCAYIWDFWHVLDLVAVTTAWISLLPLGAGNFAVLRSVRVLRPLRTVQRVKGMRILVGSLVASLPSLLDVFELFGFLMLVFGVIGVETFAGRLHYRCVDAAGEETGDLCTCPGATVLAIERRAPEAFCPDMCGGGASCTYLEHNPEGGAFSFDWILPALADIFMCITLEGWSDLMYMLQQPSPVLSVVFFILLIFFGSFFVFNLVLVVVAENYLKVRAQTDKEMREQKARDAAADAEAAEHSLKETRPPLSSRVAAGAAALWADLVRRMRECYDGWPALRRVTNHRRFGQLMVCIILLNTLVMAMEAYGSKVTEDYLLGLRIANYVFTGIFLLEMAVKLIADGLVRYLTDPFNAFDAVVVVLSVLEIALSLVGRGLINLSALRTLRLARAFKLARSFQGLRRIIKTIAACMAQARDLSLLLVLLIFIFALLGVEIFGGSMGQCDLSCAPVDEVPDGAYRSKREGCMQASGVWDAAENNFDSMLNAMMTVFIVFVGENWNSVWIDGFAHHGHVATFYFVVAVLVGNFILLNLFVAILVGNYNSDDDKPGAEPAQGEPGSAQPTSSHRGGVAAQIHDAREREAKREECQQSPSRRADHRASARRTAAATPKEEELASMHTAAGPPRPNHISLPPREASEQASHTGGALETSRWQLLHRPVELLSAELRDPTAHRGWDAVADTYRKGELATPKAGDGGKGPLDSHLIMREATAPGQDPLCLPSDSPLRLACLRLVLRPQLEWFIIALIIVSSVSLALDDPARPNSELARVLLVVDVACTALFLAELLLKVLAFGLYRPRHGYLRSHWNKLDALVVVVSIASIVLALVDTSADLDFINALRALRVLRPLRLVNRFKGMRTVLLAIFNTLPECLDVMAVALFFNLLFAIVGVQQFGGRFGFCIEPLDAAANASGDAAGADCAVSGTGEAAVLVPEPYTLNQTACLAAGRLWVNPTIGDFDNTFNAMLVLFEILTAEMWPDYLTYLTATYKPFEAPRSDWSDGFAVIYAALWIVVGTLFLGNLIVGILIDNFDKLRGDERGRGLLTHEQMEWVAVQLVIVEARARRRPRRPSAHRRRAVVYDVVMSRRFARLISSLILLNALLLAVAHYEMSPGLAQALDALNYAFTAVWVLEASLKIYGLYWRAYFSFSWNVFDFCLALTSVVDAALSITADCMDEAPHALAVTLGYMRLLRLLRLLRVIQSIPALRLLLASLLKSLPSLVSVGSLLMLLLFVYAVLGVQFFYNVKHGEFINRSANFRHVPIAMLTLFRSITGESWNGIMHDLQTRAGGVTWVTQLTGNPPRAPPGWPVCTGYAGGCAYCSYADDDCGDWYAIPYYLSFSLFSFFLLLNAVIAVLLEHFSDIEATATLPLANLDCFLDEWSRLDPSATRETGATNLLVLLRKVPPPLGIDRSRPYALLEALHCLCAPSNRLYVHKGQNIFLHETLMALARRNVELPIDGVGSTRFALQHRAFVRANMRAHGQPARLYSASKMGRPDFLPQTSRPRLVRHHSGPLSSTSHLLRMDGITVMDIWAAQLLQACWKGLRARRIYKLVSSKRVLPVPPASAAAGADAGGASQRKLADCRLTERRLAPSPSPTGGPPPARPQPVAGRGGALRHVQVSEVRLPRFDPGAARKGTLAEALLPSAYVCTVAPPPAPLAAEAPYAMGVFVADPHGHFPCRWVPCELVRVSGSRGSGVGVEKVCVRYALSAAGGKPLIEADVLEDPPRVLRLLAAYRASLGGRGATAAGEGPAGETASGSEGGGLSDELGMAMCQLRIGHMERNLGELRAERAALAACIPQDANRLAEIEEDIGLLRHTLKVLRRAPGCVPAARTVPE